MLALQFQFDCSQWWQPETIAEHQFNQLAILLRHAGDHVPYYRRLFAKTGINPAKDAISEYWQSIPVLTREQLQDAGTDLFSLSPPGHHGQIKPVSTSGSTGRPVKVLTTDVTRLFWSAFHLRDFRWHHDDFRVTLAAIRPDKGTPMGRGLELPYWGSPFSDLYETSKAVILHSTTGIKQQMEWLIGHQPAYLISLPSNLRALAEEYAGSSRRLDSLQCVRCFGETLTDDTRLLLEETFSAVVIDTYSSQETGYIGLQCPQYKHYHIQSEGVKVEILDEEDNPCRPGQIGRVVISVLHNFASPLIRYEIMDYAEMGENCPCGRGLPVLKRILGRQRNMLSLPDGTRHWPSFPAERWGDIAPIRQIQMIQKSVSRILIRLVSTEEISAVQKEKLIDVFQATLGYPFEFDFEPVPEIPRMKNGKYEDFISEI